MSKTTNHLGERTFTTRAGWRRAVTKQYPGATFHSHEGTCNAFYGPVGNNREVGFWDDTEGTLYEWHGPVPQVEAHDEGMA